ncbi:MAG: sigma-54-dependent Fis family transcriptional regulator, partial [Deltaproteobacteria bacterium]|nr:sigma-54-dependent Fis family transcriptional regulator [Deltaproteobacteria bacterium]
LLACTRADLRSAVEAGRFREDLYNCLSVVHISLPPLRERKDEIDSLARYFVKLFNFRYGRSYPGLSEETQAVFLKYDWPGNITELQDIIRRIVVSEDEKAVVREMVGGRGPSGDSPLQFRVSHEGVTSLREIGRRAAKEAEKGIILDMLERTHWNRRKTAALLQISYKALLYKIREYDLDR